MKKLFLVAIGGLFLLGIFDMTFRLGYHFWKEKNIVRVFSWLHHDEKKLECNFRGGELLRNLFSYGYTGTGRYLLGKTVVYGSSLRNSVVADNDGFLYYISSFGDDYDREAGMLQVVSDCAARNGSRLLACEIPTKQLNEITLPGNGLRLPVDMKYRQYLAAVAARGIPLLNLGIPLRNTGKTREELFYHTDHHWTPYAGSVAARAISEALLGADAAERLWANCKMKVVRGKEKQRGMQAVYFGTPFCKADLPVSYIPDDNTRFDVTITRDDHATERKQGTLTETMLRSETDPSYGNFWNNSDYPLIEISSSGGVRDERKLLIVQDSYGRVPSAFLSLVFRNVTVLDPRFFSNADLERFFNDHRFDFVLLLRSRHTIGLHYNGSYRYGKQPVTAD